MNLIIFWDKPNTIKLIFIERKIKVMEIKSTNINKTNNYISFQMIKKKTTTYVDVNPIPCLGLAQTCIGQYIEELDHSPLPS